MRTTEQRLFDVIRSSDYVMTLAAARDVTPRIHCILRDSAGECSWVFPELDNEPGIYAVPLHLLKKDLENGELWPLHINPDLLPEE